MTIGPAVRGRPAAPKANHSIFFQAMGPASGAHGLSCSDLSLAGKLGCLCASENPWILTRTGASNRFNRPTEPQ